MLRKTLVDAVEILPLFLFIMVAKLLPLQKKVFLGGVLVGWLIRLNKNLKTRIIDNLQLTMPHITVEEKQDFIKKFGTLAGKTFTEQIFDSEFQKSVSEFEYKPEELEPLLKAKTEGRPIIIVSAHLGPWEAVRAVLKKNNLKAYQCSERGGSLNCELKGERVFIGGYTARYLVGSIHLNSLD